MRPLWLLHALTRDRHDLAELGAAYGDDARAFDLLGHGDAARASRYNVTDYADALPRPAQGTVLYGHSLGGLAALCLAARHPGEIAALILEDSPLFSSRPPRFQGSPYHRGFLALRQILAEHGARSLQDWRQAVASWPSGHGELTILEASGEAGVARRAAQIAALDPATLDAPIDGTLNEEFEVIASLRAAGCPTIILAGASEKGSALDESDLRLLAGEPNVTIVRFPDAGHYIHEAHLHRVTAIVRDVS